MSNLVEEKGDEKNWGTPQKFLDVLYQFDSVGLDPCSNEHSIVKAREHWTEYTQTFEDKTIENKLPEETFIWPWGGRGLVYCNPPYGKESDVFFEKMAKEGALGTEIIALVPGRTDVKRWHEKGATTADAECKWKGRISFIDPITHEVKPGTKFPSIVLYWGLRIRRFKQVFEKYGDVKINTRHMRDT